MPKPVVIPQGGSNHLNYCTSFQIWRHPRNCLAQGPGPLITVEVKELKSGLGRRRHYGVVELDFLQPPDGSSYFHIPRANRTLGD